MPKANGNMWNMPQSSCNRLVQQRIDFRQHDRHISALQKTKGMVDHTSPKEHSHLRSKPKTKKLQEDRAAEIQLENRILLQKMLNIDTKPSPVGGDNLNSQRVLPRSLHGESQRRELDRITSANQELLKRLQDARPSICPRSWEEEEMDRQALKYRLSQNSCRGRVSKLPMPAKVGMQTGGMGIPMLPRIGGSPGRFQDDDWAKLTSQELDERLLEIENDRGAGKSAAARDVA